jgi:hypothetical protein
MICDQCKEWADAETLLTKPDGTRLGHPDCGTPNCACQHRAGTAIPENSEGATTA